MIERLRQRMRATGWPEALAFAVVLSGLFIGGLPFPSLGIGLLIVFSLFSLAIAAGIALVLRHLAAATSWLGIMAQVLIVIVGWPFALGVLPPSFVFLTTPITLLMVGASGALLVTLVALAWQYDVGIAMIAAGSLILIWGLVFAALAQDDLVAAIMRVLTVGDVTATWWLGPIFQSAFCLFPLGMASIAIHTIIALRRELQGEDPPPGGSFDRQG